MPRERYSGTAIALHWLVAALVLCTFPLGLYMHDLPLSPTRLRFFSFHRWIGVTVFGLAVLRALWRLTHRAPPMPATVPVWQRRAAHAVHGALYVLLLAIPLSGWLSSSAAGVPTVYLGLWQLPEFLTGDEALADTLKLVHQALNFMLLALVVLHVAAALKHQFVDRDGLIGRMLPGRSARE